ncbi:hypothetical protein L6164_024239 [Bauhinia variegata]|uniref:Uncharacterized protein n=1 Tax=Bauhinia variegata TaxID=167791 RepID=A0ACB9LX34_BAUVA|nr:hypothetical protein L6164_024239 [Bauhinia variegata]
MVEVGSVKGNHQLQISRFGLGPQTYQSINPIPILIVRYPIRYPIQYPCLTRNPQARGNRKTRQLRSTVLMPSPISGTDNPCLSFRVPKMAAASKISATEKLIYCLRDTTTYAINNCRPSLLASFSTKPFRIRTITSTSTPKKQKQKSSSAKSSSSVALVKEKRRTRSDREFDKEAIQRYGDNPSHIPVMLAEILDVFSATCWRPLHSFVDCTLGAAGHSSAIINAHPELELFIGMDVDPVAHEKAQAEINTIFHGQCSRPASDLKVYTMLKNFRHIKSALKEVGEERLGAGIDGILMDLGISSMQVNNPKRGFSVLGNGPLDMRMDPQASLRAEDILNSWPDAEVGRILRDYGEESTWRTLQKKIVNARLHGGLHCTNDLVDLIKHVTPAMKGGRQGWIKTATRVFQALRIAVNDELKTLEDSLYSCFDCLAPGGRLAVISFHSLEDRIVKQTFLDIIKGKEDSIDEGEVGSCNSNSRNEIEEAAWIRHIIHGSNGTILTKRPITPSEEEEELNRRSRSAKLRVIQKL